MEIDKGGDEYGDGRRERTKRRRGIITRRRDGCDTRWNSRGDRPARLPCACVSMCVCVGMGNYASVCMLREEKVRINSN